MSQSLFKLALSLSEGARLFRAGFHKGNGPFRSFASLRMTKKELEGRLPHDGVLYRVIKDEGKSQSLFKEGRLPRRDGKFVYRLATEVAIPF